MFKCQRATFFIPAALLLLLFFQNCSSKVDFKPIPSNSALNQNSDSAATVDATSSETDSTQSRTPTSTNPPDGNTAPGTGQTPIEMVQSSCNTNNRQKITRSFYFPKPKSTCDWGKNGNLEPRNLYSQARIEEENVLSLPSQSIICDMKFNFSKQQFLYDDHFLMTFNDAVIASSYNFDKVLTSKNNLLRYDWAKMAGMYWDTSKEGKFCASGGLCNWPVTDTPGDININYDSSVFQKIMSEDIKRNEHSLKFISIGDNDEYDCEHSDINFTIDVEFVTN